MSTPLVTLLPSPLLGPSAWTPVHAVLAERGWDILLPSSPPGPPRTGEDVLDWLVAALPADKDLVLIPHSNAGAYVPALTEQLSVTGYVFVDAVLPPRSGRLPLAPQELLDSLRSKADGVGVLPPWTQWWGESEVADLFPSAAVRARVEREQPRLPLSYFEGSLSIQKGWDDRPGGYLAFGDTYANEREGAVRRGWPVRTLAGQHLHLLARPDLVTTTLVDLLEELGFAPDPRT
ncbi:MAG: hypothetical protein ACRDQA_00975 [Nocardioidaceae bacterium]